MARKTGGGLRSKMPEGKVHITYVKKAGMWCKTWFEDFTQKQEWTVDKPQTEKKEKETSNA